MLSVICKKSKLQYDFSILIINSGTIADKYLQLFLLWSIYTEFSK